MLDVASKLGPLATGLATDKTDVTGQVEAKLEVEWEIASPKAYGEPAEGQQADVEDIEEASALPEKGRTGVETTTKCL